MLASDIGKRFIGEYLQQGIKIFPMASLPVPKECRKIKKGLKLSPAPVQELRLMASLLSLPTVWNTGHRRF